MASLVEMYKKKNNIPLGSMYLGKGGVGIPVAPPRTALSRGTGANMYAGALTPPRTGSGGILGTLSGVNNTLGSMGKTAIRPFQQFGNMVVAGGKGFGELTGISTPGTLERYLNSLGTFGAGVPSRMVEPHKVLFKTHPKHGVH
jgi:hypothetical protein